METFTGRLGYPSFLFFFRTSIVFFKNLKIELGDKIFYGQNSPIFIRSCGVLFLAKFPKALFGGPLFALADIPDDPGLVILAPWMIQETRRWKKPMINAAERKSCLFSPMCIFQSVSKYHIDVLWLYMIVMFRYILNIFASIAGRMIWSQTYWKLFPPKWDEWVNHPDQKTQFTPPPIFPHSMS